MSPEPSCWVWRSLARLWAVAFVCWAPLAVARTVAVVHSASSDTTQAETVARVHGELLAVGLHAQVVDWDGPASDENAQSNWVLELQKQERFDAIIAVSGDGGPPIVRVWVFEASALVRRAEVNLEPGTENAPERVAIRAIDVLRSTFHERDMKARDRQVSSEPGRETAKDDLPKGDPEPVAFGLAVGVATLTGIDGVGPALMPTARLDLALSSRWILHALAAGLGTRPSVAATPHSALVRQDYAVVGARYRFNPDGRWHPGLGLAAGVLSTSVEGQAEPPERGQSAELQSLLVEASASAEWDVFDRYFAGVATHVQLAEPRGSVLIVDSVAATTGRPNLALTLTFGAWL